MIKVPLKGDYRDKGFAGDSVTLREPLWADYFAIGPIAEYQKDASGVDILLVYEDRIERYAERLADANAQPALSFLSLADTLAVRSAITGFFSSARRSSTSQPDTSSGGGDGVPAISTT